MDVEANVIDELEIDVTLVLARALLLLLERLQSIEYRSRLVLENVSEYKVTVTLFTRTCAVLYTVVLSFKMQCNKILELSEAQIIRSAVLYCVIR